MKLIMNTLHKFNAKVSRFGFHHVLVMVILRIHHEFIKNCSYRIRSAKCRLLCMELGKRSKIDSSVKITGHNYISVGDDITINRNCHLKSMRCMHQISKTTINIGNNVFINEGTIIDANYCITVGDETMFGPYCLMIDNNHIYTDCSVPISKQGCTYKPISIGKNCWIGAHVIILPGVSIGDHAVIAANSTVNKDIPSFSIAGGTPAKVIKFIPM